MHESGWIADRRLAGRGRVQVPPLSFAALGDQGDQRAFPGLTGPGDEDYSGISQGLGDGCFGVTGQQPA